MAPKMRCMEDQTKDNIGLGQGLSELRWMGIEEGRQSVKGEQGEKKPEGKFERLKIKNAKEQDREKESQREEEWSIRVGRCRAGREGGRAGWLR